MITDSIRSSTGDGRDSSVDSDETLMKRVEQSIFVNELVFQIHVVRCKTTIPSTLPLQDCGPVHSSSESSTTKWGDTSESDATSTSCLFPIKSIIIPSILNVVTSSSHGNSCAYAENEDTRVYWTLYLLSRSRSAIPANLSTTIASYEMSYALLLTSSVTGSCTAPVQLCSLSSQVSMELLSVNHRDNSCSEEEKFEEHSQVGANTVNRIDRDRFTDDWHIGRWETCVSVIRCEKSALVYPVPDTTFQYLSE